MEVYNLYFLKVLAFRHNLKRWTTNCRYAIG